ncbi:hypothetical protein OUZ56_009241 [Daphnia magna]|uniref:Uncharacterized protein n=1 Tax=Daphnia magna TaxID=35525 RepID=A0ABR0AFG8_9CRUS|nr:hypothetical protein OUZ56_009241 [Daphnia magna]
MLASLYEVSSVYDVPQNSHVDFKASGTTSCGIKWNNCFSAALSEKKKNETEESRNLSAANWDSLIDDGAIERPSWSLCDQSRKLYLRLPAAVCRPGSCDLNKLFSRSPTTDVASDYFDSRLVHKVQTFPLNSRAELMSNCWLAVQLHNTSFVCHVKHTTMSKKQQIHIATAILFGSQTR